MTKNNTPATGGIPIKKHQIPFSALILALLLALGVSPALADDKGGAYGGGYSGPGPAPVTVEQAKELRNDAWVALNGTISKNLGGKHYEFTDATGTIKVEISDKRWNGQNIGPDDLVEIYGELDKEWSKVEIEVKRIRKI